MYKHVFLLITFIAVTHFSCTELSCMSAEELRIGFSILPKEIKRYIVYLSLAALVQFDYALIKRIEVGNPVYAIALSPDGDSILTGSDDGIVRLWDSRTGHIRQELSGHKAPVMAVAWSPDGKKILSRSHDSTIIIWDSITGQQIPGITRKLSEFTFSKTTYAAVFSPQSDTLLTGSSDRTARLWDIETGLELKRFEGHSGSVNSVAFTNAGDKIVTGSNDFTTVLWSTTGEKLQEFKGSRSLYIDSVACSPDDTSILTGSCNNSTACLWDIQTGQLLRKFKQELNISLVAFSPDRTTVLTRSRNTARLWDSSSGALLQQLTGHQMGISSVAFNATGSSLITGSADKTIGIWKETQCFSEEKQQKAYQFFLQKGLYVLLQESAHDEEK